jgi:chromosomal replication initiator protein
MSLQPIDIIRRVAQYRGVSVADLKGPRRWAHFVQARHECYWLIRQHTRMSLPSIGHVMGNRDHSTILSGIRRVDALAQRSEAYADELGRMCQVDTFAAALQREAA